MDPDQTAPMKQIDLGPDCFLSRRFKMTSTLHTADQILSRFKQFFANRIENHVTPSTINISYMYSDVSST